MTIIQERQERTFVVTESLSLKDDLDTDSVDLMGYLDMEDEFNIEISDEEIDQLQSVGDVVEVVKKVKAKRSMQVVFFLLSGKIKKI